MKRIIFGVLAALSIVLLFRSLLKPGPIDILGIPVSVGVLWYALQTIMRILEEKRDGTNIYNDGDD